MIGGADAALVADRLREMRTSTVVEVPVACKRRRVAMVAAPTLHDRVLVQRREVAMVFRIDSTSLPSVALLSSRENVATTVSVIVTNGALTLTSIPLLSAALMAQPETAVANAADADALAPSRALAGTDTEKAVTVKAAAGELLADGAGATLGLGAGEGGGADEGGVEGGGGETVGGGGDDTCNGGDAVDGEGGGGGGGGSETDDAGAGDGGGDSNGAGDGDGGGIRGRGGGLSARLRSPPRLLWACVR